MKTKRFQSIKQVDLPKRIRSIAHQAHLLLNRDGPAEAQSIDQLRIEINDARIAVTELDDSETDLDRWLSQLDLKLQDRLDGLSGSVESATLSDVTAIAS